MNESWVLKTKKSRSEIAREWDALDKEATVEHPEKMTKPTKPHPDDKPYIIQPKSRPESVRDEWDILDQAAGIGSAEDTDDEDAEGNDHQLVKEKS